jgi:hypothetical protein
MIDGCSSDRRDHLRPGAGEVRAVSVTYANALVAYIERWGREGLHVYHHDGDADFPPFDSAECTFTPPGGLPLTRDLTCLDGALTLFVMVHRDGDHRDEDAAMWTLAGEPSADAPLTPLPDAIDAAVRWMAEHAP